MAMEAEIAQNYYLAIMNAEKLLNIHKMYANERIKPSEIRQLNWHSYANFSSTNYNTSDSKWYD